MVWRQRFVSWGGSLRTFGAYFGGGTRVRQPRLAAKCLRLLRGCHFERVLIGLEAADCFMGGSLRTFGAYFGGGTRVRQPRLAAKCLRLLRVCHFERVLIGLEAAVCFMGGSLRTFGAYFGGGPESASQGWRLNACASFGAVGRMDV